MQSNTLSIQEIRSHFPALNRKHNGYPIAYLEGPAGTQVPLGVTEAISDYLLNHNANAHFGFPTSIETDQIIESAREAFADLFNCRSKEISFGANMTTITFHIARALGRRFQAGDEVLVTELDHHANVAPWQTLVKERGIVIRTIKMIPETGELDWEDFQSKLNAKTKLLALGAASNLLGTITDVKKYSKLAHQAGALVFVDAVHYAPHRLIDVQEFDCDFLACSAYKFYGTHLGILYGKYDLLNSLDVPKLAPSPNEPPEKLETGTKNHEGIAGATAAVNFLASLADGRSRREKLENSYTAHYEHSQELINLIWEGLQTIKNVKIFGPAPDRSRTPTFSFLINNLPPSKAMQALVEFGIFVSHGHFYAPTTVERLDVNHDGFIRVGCMHYTSREEIERMLDAVRIIAK